MRTSRLLLRASKPSFFLPFNKPNGQLSYKVPFTAMVCTNTDSPFFAEPPLRWYQYNGTLYSNTTVLNSIRVRPTARHDVRS